MIPILDSVRKAYGAHTVLDGVSLSLAESGINCLLGPSGCGKSTLLRITASLIPPDAGRVLINPGQSAVVFQEPRLLPWLSVEENLALATLSGSGREKRRQISEALALVQLENVEHLLPRELSGGMAQRTGLARALLRRPRFLLMDEPFAALDAITRGDLQKMIITLIAEQKMACLFVTHDINEALLIASHIHVIQDGKIVFDYAMDDGCNHNPIKQQILAYLQSKKEHE